MAHEASKAMRRRIREDPEFWTRVLSGERKLDVGAGPDCLPGFQPFDLEHGDANRLSDYFPENHFDCLHASQCLEHMCDPRCAMLEWIRVVKPSGHLVISVPDVGAYERFRYPSVTNPDHKASFSMIYFGSLFPIHINIPSFLRELEPYALTLRAEYIERNFNWKLSPHIDQTWNESDGVEVFIEFVLRKCSQ